MKKVFMCPTPTQAKKDDTNSIHQIVLHLERELPRHGWELTENESEADLRAGHAGQTYGFDNVEVAHCHGLYPTYLFSHKRHFGANKNVIKHLKAASAITVPSEWVADIIRREMNIEPFVINWGVVTKEWKTDVNKKYALWNKTRVSDVCDPASIVALAKAYPENDFVTTFSGIDYDIGNLKITGRVVFDTMKTLIKESGVYIATTKETFGIGILEAMAAGKPILAYDWGALPDIIEHGVTGILVKPNDIDSLIEGLRWIWNNYSMLSQNCITAALNPRYNWSSIAWRFAQVYNSVADTKESNDVAVSVIIPCHNYETFVPMAVDSVIMQKTDFDFEILVINDASTDNSGAICKSLCDHYAAQGVNIRYIENEVNLHVAETRNKGISLAKGVFIVCLDSDDKLGKPNFLQVLFDYMVANPSVGVAYTGLGVFLEDEGLVKKSDWPASFNVTAQLEGKNQVPTCNMFLKEAWHRAGGYRRYQQPSEDAALWTSIALLGYDIRQATKEFLFLYRWHDDSLSSHIRNGTSQEPYWRRQWHAAIDIKPPFISTQAPENGISHPVNNYDTPVISVIIPVGAGHEIDVIRAIDSVQSQTFQEWECIVINDTGNQLNLPHKWVKLIDTDGQQGTGVARNLGIKESKADFIVFLDSDDMLLPDFLEETLRAYKRTGRYIYTDWYGQRGKVLTETKANGYEQSALVSKSSIHAVTCLIPTIWVKDVGGFDETLSSWEDSDFFVKLAIAGHCGQHLKQSLFVYNYDSGKRREMGVSNRDALVNEFNRRYADYRNGHKEMCACDDLVNRERNSIDWNKAIQSGEMIRVEMVSGAKASTHIVGHATRQPYGRRQIGDVFFMYAKDVQSQPDFFKPIGNAPLQLSVTEMPSGKPKRLTR